MKHSFLLAFILLLRINLYSQSGAITGNIRDDENNAIPGAIIYDLTSDSKTVSDESGSYYLNISVGNHMIICSFIGMKNDTLEISIQPGDTLVKNFHLQSSSVTLNVVVVSAGRFEQKVEDLTVSMEVIKPSLVESRNSTNIKDVLEQVPGVTILDGEPQIRSGSGFSFGVGSRSAVLVDGLPVLVGDQGRPEWSFLPLENMEQTEIIKGAASVLYGSSALNGVINLRTAYPHDKPETKITTYYGQYDSPSIENSKWWNGTAPLYGLTFLHTAKYSGKKNLEVTIGGQALYNHNYIGLPLKIKYIPIAVDSSLTDDDASTKSGRINFNLRYRPTKINNLSFGVNGNFMQNSDNYSLIWLNDSSGIYRAFPGTMTLSKTFIYYIDPFINYFSASGLNYSLRFRILGNDAQNGNDQSTKSTIFYSEYQASKEFTKVNLHSTFGLAANNVYSEAKLYAGSGNPVNKSANYAAFLQLDKKIKSKLNLSAGFRIEYFETNEKDKVLKPIFRGGLSYTIFKGTFFRMSYGQGYRYPSITEKFIYTSTGGIKVLPNSLLKPETSRSYEAGIRQGFKAGKFLGFADACIFLQNYSNTIEYIYANWGYDSTGFKFVNTGNTSVKGCEFSLMGSGKFTKNFSVTLLAGYTYTLPTTDDPDYIFATENPKPPLRPKKLSYLTTSTDTSENILKYRFQHTAKGDLELTWRFISVGFSMRYYSFMKNIDQTFYELDNPYILPTGIKEYRNDHDKGTVIYDARIHTDIGKHVGIGFIINNLENKSYSLRPLKIESPRVYSVQMITSF